MSKSRGTFITARTWLEHLPAEYLRYYYASQARARRRRHRPEPRGLRRAGQLRPGRQARQHREPLRRLHRARLGGRLADALPEPALYAAFVAAGRQHRRGLRGPRLRRASCARSCCSPTAPTSTSTSSKPWLLAKDPARAAEVQARLHAGHQPVPAAGALPQAGRAASSPPAPSASSGCRHQRWADVRAAAARPRHRPYEPLATRVDPAATKALLAPLPRASSRPARRTRQRHRGASAAAARSRPRRRPAETARSADHDRRLREGRPAHRAHRRGRAGRGRRQAAAADGGPRHRAAHRVRRHPPGVRSPSSSWAGSRSWSPTSRRARCASARPRAWCSPRARAAADIFLLAPDTGAQPGMKVK